MSAVVVLGALAWTLLAVADALAPAALAVAAWCCRRRGRRRRGVALGVPWWPARTTR